MPSIHFDVLVPDAASAEVAQAFQRACDILVRRGALISGEVSHEPAPLLDADTTAQLQRAYAEERGEDPGDARVHRYSISAEGATSYNKLAMGLSRVLTPKAALPADPAALMDQERFEVPAVYPWTVAVLR
ncbi:hypothetical protein CAPI_04320 [Corynebacterium capitovis DSM 44611]|uniref:hypothetical protein n=1 Tax=Corynebacterium capitovis TaxID=131081 RepID=UPI000375CEB9|nr:hypothetical protein [Corynebacterium capitovis]WKD57422.1 hypothetical protein CAPI_04320 [Corynebacterium capitovis DSM 44611]